MGKCTADDAEEDKFLGASPLLHQDVSSNATSTQWGCTLGAGPDEAKATISLRASYVAADMFCDCITDLTANLSVEGILSTPACTGRPTTLLTQILAGGSSSCACRTGAAPHDPAPKTWHTTWRRKLLLL